jgi:hypothetical protein
MLFRSRLRRAQSETAHETNKSYQRCKRRGQGSRFGKVGWISRGPYDVQRVFDSNQNRAKLWMLNLSLEARAGKGLQYCEFADNERFTLGKACGWTCNGASEVTSDRSVRSLAPSAHRNPQDRSHASEMHASRRGLAFCCSSSGSSKQQAASSKQQHKIRDLDREGLAMQGRTSASCFAGR